MSDIRLKALLMIVVVVAVAGLVGGGSYGGGTPVKGDKPFKFR